MRWLMLTTCFVALGAWAFTVVSVIGPMGSLMWFGWNGFLAWLAFPFPFAAYVYFWAWRRWRDPYGELAD